MIRLAAIGALILGGVFYVGMRVGARLSAAVMADLAARETTSFERVWDDGYQTGVLVAMSQN